MRAPLRAITALTDPGLSIPNLAQPNHQILSASPQWKDDTLLASGSSIFQIDIEAND